MSRDALIVGINPYTNPNLRSLTAAAADAEAIAQLLQQQGEFQVRRLPGVVREERLQVGQATPVTVSQLEEAIVQLFLPESQQVPDTALFYFSGHGLRKNKGVTEGFLATSDVDPSAGKWGISLQWLCQILEKSPIRQQIIWLDCCHAGELLNVAESNPGDRGQARDRCFIAASRDFETAWQDISSPYSVLTKALLEGLDPARCPDRWVTNYSVVDFLNQHLQGATQCPTFSNFGEPIHLTRQWQAIERQTVSTGSAVCPYRGLRYFDWNEEDPKYFYGRTALISQLIDQVRQSNFLAIVGASGSGKSSVLRAGLLHQLQQGQRLSGSNRWDIRILLPGDRPMQALAQAFVGEELAHLDRAEQLGKAEGLLRDGADGLRRLIETATTERFVLVVDQFEEVFTVCQDEAERQQFFHCLLQGLHLTPKLCVIVAMRADFFGKCMEQEYSGLAKQIEQHLVAVVPMNWEELREAIAKPATRVNLTLEPQLVEEMIADVSGAPGSLPLLQYTLTELWKQQTEAGISLTQYSQLGGISGTLQKRATAVYEDFPEAERSTVQHIFMALTQLGEGTEDTRRRVLLADLVNAQHPAAIVNRVVQRLADEKLIVTSEIVGKGTTAPRVAVVDVAHEALIRHWALLRSWLQDRRDRLRQMRKLEAAANEWRDRGEKAEDLLQGRTLTNAQQFQKEQVDQEPLNALVDRFIQKSVKQRRVDRLKLSSFLVIPAIVIGLMVETAMREEGVKQDYKRLDSSSQIEEQKTVESMVAGCDAAQSINVLPPFISERIFGNCRSLSKAPLEKANLRSANLRSANLSSANLRSANLTSAFLTSANLTRADLTSADLTSAFLSNANLTRADLTRADLTSAFLSNADLRSTNLTSVILLATDFRESNGLTQAQLERNDPPLLCHVALPQDLKQIVNPDRDCDRLPPVLRDRYPTELKTLDAAKAYVDKARQKKWNETKP